jgi:hypothetical protein
MGDQLNLTDLLLFMQILGSGMSNKMWDVAVEHAKTCVLSGKLYVFYADNGPPTRAGQSGCYSHNLNMLAMSSVRSLRSLNVSSLQTYN